MHIPIDTQMITRTLGVRESNGTVYYLHSGVPIFSHETGDLNKFRYITSNLILQGLCSNQDIAGTFHVSLDSVRRWKDKLYQEGDGAFFNQEARLGEAINCSRKYWNVSRQNSIKGQLPIPLPKAKGYRRAASGMR
jgi:hypothetical protein